MKHHPYSIFSFINLTTSSGLLLSFYTISKSSLYLYLYTILSQNTFLLFILIFFILYPILFLYLINPLLNYYNTNVYGHYFTLFNSFIISLHIYLSIILFSSLVVLNVRPLLYFSYYYLLNIFMIILIILSLASLLTILERKGLASSQIRLGPNYHGIFGLVQIVFDGLKLIVKDYNLINTNPSLLIASLLNFLYSYLLIIILYLDFISLYLLPYLVLFIILLLIINHIVIMLCSFITNQSSWTILSCIRLCIVFVLYDVLFILLILSFNISSSYHTIYLDFSFHNLLTQVYSNPIIMGFFLFMSLIEVGRVPMDLIEAESELISGYNIEYGGFLYALFASSEYATMLFHTFLISIFFSYRSLYLFYLQFSLVFLIFIIIRSTLPRFKFDSLFHKIYQSLFPLVISSLLSSSHLSIYKLSSRRRNQTQPFILQPLSVLITIVYGFAISLIVLSIIIVIIWFIYLLSSLSLYYTILIALFCFVVLYILYILFT